MKKALIIIGITAVVACLLCLAFAIFFNHACHNVYDGSPSLYARLHRRALICFETMIYNIISLSFTLLDKGIYIMYNV